MAMQVQLLPPSHFTLRPASPKHEASNGTPSQRNDAATGRRGAVDAERAADARSRLEDAKSVVSREWTGQRMTTSNRTLGANEELVLAKSLARCQKIDKSLQFYSDIRNKWCEEPNQSLPSSIPHSSPSSSNSRTAYEDASGVTAQAPPPSKPISKEKASSKPPPERHRVKQTLNDLGSYPSGRTPWRSMANGRPQPTLVLNLTQPPNFSETKERRNQLTVPHNRDPKQSGRENYFLQKPSPRTQEVRVKQNSAQHFHLYQTHRDTEERLRKDHHLNDFDSIQEDCGSDSASIKPVHGKFGQLIHPGAYPVPLPHWKTSQPSNDILRHSKMKNGGNSLDTRALPGGVCSKQSTTTHNDTVIAQVLQAEEESRAGIPLIPNTSNDFAIAKRMQEDLNQAAQTRPTTSSQSSAAPAAVARGHPIVNTQLHWELAGGQSNSSVARSQPRGTEGWEAAARPTGLDSAMIERMSHQYIFKEKQYQPYDDPSAQPVTECAVCLDVFHVGEPLRLMPCSHTFHRYCVDRWLEKNTICPVCKSDYIKICEKIGINV